MDGAFAKGAAAVAMAGALALGMGAAVGIEAATPQQACAKASNAKAAKAKKAVEKAKARKARAMRAWKGAKAELARAKADGRYDAWKRAEEVRARGSAGFFSQRTDTQKGESGALAMDVLRNAKYASWTRMGKRDDATSLANMEAAIDMVGDCNTIRRANRLPELKVDDYMMAVAQVNANWSAKHNRHSEQYIAGMSTGENLAWDCGLQRYVLHDVPHPCDDNPFYGWYDQEFPLEFAQHSASGSGHLENILYDKYRTSGFAINGNVATRWYDDRCFSQTFSDDGQDAIRQYLITGTVAREVDYTYRMGAEYPAMASSDVAGYKRQFEAYYGPVKRAQAPYDRATRAEKSAASKYKKTAKALSRAQSDYKRASR